MQFVVVKTSFQDGGGTTGSDQTPLFFVCYYVSYGLLGPILTLVAVDSMLVARFEPWTNFVLMYLLRKMLLTLYFWGVLYLLTMYIFTRISNCNVWKWFVIVCIAWKKKQIVLKGETKRNPKYFKFSFFIVFLRIQLYENAMSLLKYMFKESK